MPEFIEVAKKSEIKEGQRKLVEINGKSIAVFLLDGEYYAVHNHCLHKGGPVCEGELNGEIISCPWHGWRYNVKTGINAVNPNLKLEIFPVKVDGDKIMIET
ncbi:MAG TPA: Rieske 2Fe-2S domain-containing protein [Candidatus Nanoarchaeia archaeon]|nr:Rieske 2Fe-2S domain-containing protein [Candidatus Nanoarchaeia archaeon]